MDIEIQVMSEAILNTTDLTRQLREMSAIIGLMSDSVVKSAAKSALSKYGRLFVAKMVKSIGGSVDNSDVLHRRTGALARSFNHSVATIGNTTTLFVWIDSTVKDYWATQEYGGTIRAKNGKMLAIPADAAKTRAGVPKFGSPREVPGLFLVKRFNKTPKLCRIEGNKLVCYFYLVKSVKVKPRLGFRAKWKEGLPDAVSMFDSEIRAKLKEVSR
jgi:hypothetical protein